MTDHSQRCLHCDHIRATHTLTASGCIGHALPGKPGADCPCSEFEEDGMTDHDPMLDGITRWRDVGGTSTENDEGVWVKFSDLPALIARVREDERGKVDPQPPFPMGAKVRGVGGTRVLTVTGWDFYPAWGKWFVRVETGKVDDEGEREYALMHPWELELVTYEQGQRDERAAIRAKGYAAALDKARDAVTALHMEGTVIREGVLNQALAAIDALKGESNG